jgi:L-threonylcarbamoyladenylate synthase
VPRIVPADAPAIAEAAALLRRGGLVVFPTETVYGVGANGLDPAAVRSIFAAKGRPADNPVILHVSGVPMAQALARQWPEAAARLAHAFWPGPLTLVLPRAARVPPEAAGGLGTVALRHPRHPVAQALLLEAGLPIAAPSANRSGRPSPTRVADAARDLGDAAALYLDAGPTEVGVESTVVSLEGPPTLLRPGGVPREAIEAVVGPLRAAPASGRPLAPGMRYRHYAPRARVLLAPPDRLASLPDDAGTAWLVSTESGLRGPRVTVVAGRHEPEAWAHRLFALMRDLDAAGYATLVVEEIPEAGIGAAVMDRLRRAAEG